MGAPPFGRPASMTVLAIREADGPLTARETLRELLHDATEFMLGWDCIAPLKAQLGQPFRVIEARLQAAVDARYQLPPWTAEDYASHMRADRLAAACEAYPVVGWSRTDMDEALGIEIPPALRRSCSSERVCSLGAVAAPGGAGSPHGALSRARLRVPVQHVAIPNARLRTRAEPFSDAILTSSIPRFSVSQTLSAQFRNGALRAKLK